MDGKTVVPKYRIYVHAQIDKYFPDKYLFQEQDLGLLSARLGEKKW